MSTQIVKYFQNSYMWSHEKENTATNLFQWLRFMATTAFMTKQNDSKKDRHKKRKMVGIRKPFIEPTQKLVERLGLTGFSELVNLALREKLERESLWPPKPKE